MEIENSYSNLEPFISPIKLIYQSPVSPEIYGCFLYTVIAVHDLLDFPQCCFMCCSTPSGGLLFWSSLMPKETKEQRKIFAGSTIVLLYNVNDWKEKR